jgi:spore germination protein KC
VSLMKVSRLLSFLLLAWFPLCLMSGCWSSVELNDRAFARLMLIDYSDSGIELTLGFPLPNRLSTGKAGSGSSGGSGGSSTEPFAFVSKNGKNIGEAFREIQSDLTRRITFGQLRSVLIGEKFAQRGVKPLLDFLVRKADVHINANLYVTKSEVKKFTTIPVTFEKFPTDIVSAYAKDHVTMITSAKDILMATFNGGDFLLPSLVFGKKGVEREKQAGNWMGTDGAAIFKQGRMVGSLNTKEMRGALWILGQLNDAEFNVDSPTDGKSVSFIVRHARTKVKPRIDGDQINFLIQCKAIASLIETNSIIDLTDPRQLRQLEQRMADKLNERIDLAITKTKEAQTDAFQLGKYIKWHYPRKWRSIQKDWRQEYASRVNVIPQIQITVKWIGSAQKPEWNKYIPDMEAPE